VILKKIILISVPTLWCLLVTSIISFPIIGMIFAGDKYPHISFKDFVFIFALYLPVGVYILFVKHYKKIRTVFKVLIIILLTSATIFFGYLLPDVLIFKRIQPMSYTSNPSHYLDVDIDEYEEYVKHVNLFPPSIPASTENVKYIYWLKHGFSDYEWQVKSSWVVDSDQFTSELNRIESVYPIYKLNKSVSEDKNTIVYQYHIKQKVDPKNFSVEIVFVRSEKFIQYEMHFWYDYHWGIFA